MAAIEIVNQLEEFFKNGILPEENPSDKDIRDINFAEYVEDSYRELNPHLNNPYTVEYRRNWLQTSQSLVDYFAANARKYMYLLKNEYKPHFGDVFIDERGLRLATGTGAPSGGYYTFTIEDKESEAEHQIIFKTQEKYYTLSQQSVQTIESRIGRESGNRAIHRYEIGFNDQTINLLKKNTSFADPNHNYPFVEMEEKIDLTSFAMGPQLMEYLRGMGIRRIR